MTSLALLMLMWSAEHSTSQMVLYATIVIHLDEEQVLLIYMALTSSEG